MQQVKQYLAEIEKKLLTFSGKISWVNDDFLQRYYNTRFLVGGLAVPAQRMLFKQGFSFSSLPVKEQLIIWNEVYQASTIHEVKSQALIFVASIVRKNEHKKNVWNVVRDWITHTDNWAHSDALSAVNSLLLEEMPTIVFPQLKKWNKSLNSWERRQSVVSLLYYHRQRNNFLPYEDMIALVESLMEDEAYYVQKGVGWTLRELWQHDEKKTWNFLNLHLHRISSVAFTAAAEKIPSTKKEALKRKRKKIRADKKQQ